VRWKGNDKEIEAEKGSMGLVEAFKIFPTVKPMSRSAADGIQRRRSVRIFKFKPCTKGSWRALATARLGQPHESLRSIALAANAEGHKGTVAATRENASVTTLRKTHPTLPG
jgi:hypothetical protein